MEPQTRPFHFVKSSYSGAGEDQQCVALDPHAGAVMDTKNPQGAVLVVGAAPLAAFIGAVLADQLS